MNCKHETYKGKCGLKGSMAYAHKCCTKECCKCWKPVNNGENIREMNNAEQAKFFSETFCHGYGEPQLLEWLDKPAEDTP